MVDPEYGNGPSISDGTFEIDDMQVQLNDDLRQRAAKQLNVIRRIKASAGCNGLFGDPAWEILLAVSLTQAESGTTSSKLKPLTDLELPSIDRWVKVLSDTGLLQAEGNASSIALTRKALHIIDRAV